MPVAALPRTKVLSGTNGALRTHIRRWCSPPCGAAHRNVLVGLAVHRGFSVAELDRELASMVEAGELEKVGTKGGTEYQVKR